MQRSSLTKTGVRVVACAAIGLLLAGAVPAADGSEDADDIGNVQIKLDTEMLKAMRQTPMADHLRRMAVELRLSTEARLYGKAAPELTTNQIEIDQLDSGMTRARLGVGQLNIAMVRFNSNGDAVVHSHHGDGVVKSQAPGEVVQRHVLDGAVQACVAGSGVSTAAAKDILSTEPEVR